MSKASWVAVPEARREVMRAWLLRFLNEYEEQEGLNHTLGSALLEEFTDELMRIVDKISAPTKSKERTE